MSNAIACAIMAHAFIADRENESVGVTTNMVYSCQRNGLPNGETEMAQIHHRTNPFVTTIYYGTKAVAVCHKFGDQWQVGLTTPTGNKYFSRHSLPSVKEAVRLYLEAQ